MPRVTKPGMTLLCSHCGEWLYIEYAGSRQGFNSYKAPDKCPSCLGENYSKALTEGHYTLYPVAEYANYHPKAKIKKGANAEGAEDSAGDEGATGE